MVDYMQPVGAKYKVQRRVAGDHNVRLDGMYDLILRAKGMKVLDIGCNRGMVGFEFAQNGAKLVHGVDNYEVGIQTAREVFADLRFVEARFEVVDLTQGQSALKVFNGEKYDAVVMLATYHKLKRIMPPDKLSELIRFIGTHTNGYFAWRGTSDKPSENEEEIVNLDRDLKGCGMKRCHTSYISNELGVAAIWGR